MKALQQRFGDEQFIELTGTIGYYSMLAMTANACELEAGPGAAVLQAQVWAFGHVDLSPEVA